MFILNDFFNEQIVKKQLNQKDNFKKIGLGAISLIACILSTLIIPYVGMLLGIGLLFVGTYFITMLDVEYEYVMTNSIFEVDAIYNKRRRKKLLEFDIKDVIVMTKLNENKEQHTFNTAKKTYDFSSGTNNDSCYKMVIKENNENVKIIIEPNEKIFEGMKRFCKVIK